MQSAGRSSGLQGQLSHELFERALRCDSVTVSLLEQEAASIVQERVEDLCVIDCLFRQGLHAHLFACMCV